MTKYAKRTLQRNTIASPEEDLRNRSNKSNNGDITQQHTFPTNPQNIIHLQRTVGNQAVLQMLDTEQTTTTKSSSKKSIQLQRNVLQRDPDVIPIDVIEVEDHPGDISDVVTDSLRTARGCIMNFETALENFETRITNDSGKEAAPKDPAMIAMQEVGKMVLGKLRGQIASAVPGGKIAEDIVGLGEKIAKAIEAEKKRSKKATDKNAAANFIIDMRTLINDAAVDLETNMTEDIVAVRNRYDNAKSDGERDAIMKHQELINSQITQMEKGSCSTESLFTHIVEEWINETGSAHGGEAKVIINLDREWNVQEAYLDAPFGSRLAEQLEKQGPLDVMEFDVPRVVQWFPFYGQEGGGLYRCLADIDAGSGQATNVRAMGLQSQKFLQEFVNLLSQKPIPDATKVSGNKTS